VEHITLLQIHCDYDRPCMQRPAALGWLDNPTPDMAGNRPKAWEMQVDFCRRIILAFIIVFPPSPDVPFL